MLRHLLPFVVLCFLSSCLLSSCREEMVHSEEEKSFNEYNVSWFQQFGPINPEQTWNMATLVTADVNPSNFGNASTVYFYTNHPLDGGLLLGKASAPTTLKLDMVQGSNMVYVRAVDSNGAICYSAAHSVENGRVEMSSPLPKKSYNLSRAPELIEGIDGNVFPWMIACEDLGSTGDYDFNDVVLGLQHVAGDTKLKIYPMACGGIYDAKIFFRDPELNEDIEVGEIHKLLKCTGTMINTTSWVAPGDIVEVDVPQNWTLSENLSDLTIRVDANGSSIVVTAPKKGTAPQVICLRGDWYWPKEFISIKQAFPDFAKLNGSAEMTYEWMMNISDISKVIVWKFPIKKFSPEAYDHLSIPEDPTENDAPDTNDPKGNKVIPNPQIIETLQQGYVTVQMELTGIWDDAAGDWLELKGTADANQNVWITVDGDSKGVDAYNISSGGNHRIKTDVVFLIDNSGSMGEEANAVAQSVISWSETLAASNIDVAVGCVGYGEGSYAINGAFNLSTPQAIKQFLNYGSGTSRTQHFGGPDATTLKSIAQSGNYSNGSNRECGLLALRFANDNFNFRPGANRIYINFTDEVNQPAGNSKWSVEYLNPAKGNWMSNSGTVHTVFSERTTGLTSDSERPWLMSEYTGGTTVFTNSSFTGVTLETLKVTGAMQNSYILRFTNVDDILDGKDHEIVIKIKDSTGKVYEKVIIYNSEKDYTSVTVRRLEE